MALSWAGKRYGTTSGRLLPNRPSPELMEHVGREDIRAGGFVSVDGGEPQGVALTAFNEGDPGRPLEPAGLYGPTGFVSAAPNDQLAKRADFPDAVRGFRETPAVTSVSVREDNPPQTSELRGGVSEDTLAPVVVDMDGDAAVTPGVPRLDCPPGSRQVNKTDANGRHAGAHCETPSGRVVDEGTKAPEHLPGATLYDPAPEGGAPLQAHATPAPPSPAKAILGAGILLVGLWAASKVL